MKKLIFTALFTLLLATTAWAGHNDEVLDGGSIINCVTCHGMHGSFSVPTGSQVYDACTFCHSSTGMATNWDVANHVVDAGTVVDCGMCHEVHNNTARESDASDFDGGGVANNTKYIRANMQKYRPTALANTVYQNTPDHFAESEGDGVGTDLNGVCQSCHTTTKYHRNTEIGGANADHKLSGFPNTTDCTGCHGHGSGTEGDNPTYVAFKATGGHGENDTSVIDDTGDCTACHATPTNNPVTEIHGDNCGWCHIDPAGGGPLVTYLQSIPVTNPATCSECHEFTAGSKGEIMSGHHTYKTIGSSKADNGNARNGSCITCHEPDVGQPSTTRADLTMPANLACNFCHLWWPNNKDYWTDSADEGYGTTGGLVNIYNLGWTPDSAPRTHASSVAMASHTISAVTNPPISDYAACFACHGASAATKGGGKQVRPFHGLGPAPTIFEPLSGSSGAWDVLINLYAGPQSSGSYQPRRNNPYHPGFGAYNWLGENPDGTQRIRPVSGDKDYNTNIRKAHDLDEGSWLMTNPVGAVYDGSFDVPWDGYNSAISGAPGTSDTLNAGGQTGSFTIDTNVPLCPLTIPTNVTPPGAP